ncbi:MAG TPA: hypothetical protein VNT22_01415 [Baekduia sp.]|nr:hypothetical protein [Baekduia sp.]
MTSLTRNITLLAAAAAVLTVAAPATASAAKYPEVTRITPLKVGVGEPLQIRGKNFRPGKKKSTVIFKNDKGRTVFAKAETATSTKITIIVPAKLLAYMKVNQAGGRIATKFRVRILGTRLGKSYTASSKSPTISPAPVGAASGSSGDCDADGTANSKETDDDNDLLDDSLESTLRTSTCDADTDGDGVTDGYEYLAAIDYNSNNGGGTLPYPGKRPYPNALDGTDGNVDHDSDGLSSYEEYAAWTYTNRPLPLSYSDGTQWTGGKVPVASGGITGSGFKDLDGDTFIADSEKDVDNDGLDNFAETHGPLSGPGWWAAIYGVSTNNECGAQEKPYPLSSYAGTSFVDPDADGDGRLDGADDIDHDGYTNAAEAYRPGVANTPGTLWCSTYVSTTHNGSPSPNNVARVQPFNPCKPTYSGACHPPYAVPVGYYPSTEDWASPTHTP